MLRENAAKRRMSEGKPAIGVSALFDSALAAETLSRAGFDFVLIDNQHGAWNDTSALIAVRSILLGSAVPMARVRRKDFSLIGRLLDCGALGIVVPLVNSVAEAKAAAYAARYPPEGGRSVGPFGARLHGTDYLARANQEVFLAVQFESIEAVESADEILSVDGVDGCCVGPKDLANSMGADLSTAQGGRALEAAILEVLAACKRTGRVPGIGAGHDAKHWVERGFLFVVAGADADLVDRGSLETLQEIGR